jgi:hypothetical protein
MEAKYVTETVGEALTQGLAELVAVKPADPVEYLGNWLKKYRANQKVREEEENREKVCENCGQADHEENSQDEELKKESS